MYMYFDTYIYVIGCTYTHNIIIILYIYMYMFMFLMQQSGLSDWLGNQLRVLGSLPHPVIGLLVSVMVASTTEVMSNIATTTLFLPVLRNLVSTIIQ